MTHEDSPPGPSWSGALPGLGGMVLLGGTVAVTGATHHLPTFAVQSARYAVAALGVVVVARCLRVRLVPPRGSELVWVVAGALSGLVLFTLAVVLGTRHTEPGVFGAAVACVPVVLAVAGPLARGGRPSARLVTGAVVVSAGAVAVAGWSRAASPGSCSPRPCPRARPRSHCSAPSVVGRLGAWSYSAATCGVAAAVFLVLAAAVERPDPAGFADPDVLLAVGVPRPAGHGRRLRAPVHLRPTGRCRRRRAHGGSRRAEHRAVRVRPRGAATLGGGVAGHGGDRGRAPGGTAARRAVAERPCAGRRGGGT